MCRGLTWEVMRTRQMHARAHRQAPGRVISQRVWRMRSEQCLGVKRQARSRRGAAHQVLIEVVAVKKHPPQLKCSSTQLYIQLIQVHLPMQGTQPLILIGSIHHMHARWHVPSQKPKKVLSLPHPAHKDTPRAYAR